MTHRQLDSSWAEAAVSRDTLNIEDLIEMFIMVLSEVDPIDAKRYSDRFVRALQSEHSSDEVDNLFWDLYDVLDLVAPAGTYFGAHEGDGALFGFWKFEDESEEYDD